MRYPVVVIIAIDWLKPGGWWSGTVRYRPEPLPIFPFPAPEYARNYSHRCLRFGRTGVGVRNFKKVSK